MKNIIIKYTAIFIICFGLGNFTAWKFLQHEKVIIKEGPIRYNVVDRDISTMNPVDKDTDLHHFYTDKPGLEIEHVDGDNYKMTGKLYIRAWNRDVKIQTVQKTKNVIIASAYFDSQLHPGAMLQYYKMYGSMGFGGGVGGSQTAFLLNAGILWAW